MKKAKRVFLAAVLSAAMVFTIVPVGAVNAASAQRPGKVTVTAVTKSYSSVKVSWTKAKKAKGYLLYRRTGTSGKYKKIKQTTKRSYTNSGLKKNTAYYYKVKAYRNVNGKKVYGRYSYAKKAIAGAEKVTGLSVITGGTHGYLVQKWNEKNQFKGYEIYRAESENGPFTLIKTVGNSKDDYLIVNKDNTVTGNTTYWYKVRGFRVTGGKTYYGAYSAVKSGTAKNGVGEAKAYVTPGAKDADGQITEFTVTLSMSKFNYGLSMIPSDAIAQRTINEELEKGPVNIFYFDKLWGKTSHMAIESYSVNGGAAQTYSGNISLEPGDTVAVTMKAKAPLTEADAPFEYNEDGLIVVPCKYNNNLTYMVLTLKDNQGTGYAMDFTQYYKILNELLEDM